MAQQSAPPPHCKKLLEDGLGTFLDHMSNIAETEAEKQVSYVSNDLLARTFWQPTNLLIVSSESSDTFKDILTELYACVFVCVRVCIHAYMCVGCACHMWHVHTCMCDVVCDRTI